MKEENEEKDPEKKGLTRRQFIASVSTGAAALAVTSGGLPAHAAKEGELLKAGKMTKIRLHINGRRYKILVEPRWSLLFVLREKLGLTGTKAGCERGECGACTVLINGIPRYSCHTLAVEAQGNEITTLEGLSRGEELGPVQQAFLEEDGFQCGYCTPGQIMAAEGLLRANSNPSLEDVRKGMSGNLCRCGAYDHIFKAVLRAAELKRSMGGKS